MAPAVGEHGHRMTATKKSGQEQRRTGRDSRALRRDGLVTRDRLLATAIELTAEKGEAAVTLANVARRAGVTRGTAYHHFSSRQSLLEEMNANLEQQLLKLAGKDHHFRNPYGLALRLAVENESIIRSRIYRILDQGPLADPRTVNLLARFSELEAEGQLRPGIDPQSAALISAALDFAGAMAIAMGSTAEERRMLANRLSDTWHEVLVQGVMSPDRSEADYTPLTSD
jgi:AcrR family transcriptional regulator